MQTETIKLNGKHIDFHNGPRLHIGRNGNRVWESMYQSVDRTEMEMKFGSVNLNYAPDCFAPWGIHCGCSDCFFAQYSQEEINEWN